MVVILRGLIGGGLESDENVIFERFLLSFCCCNCFLLCDGVSDLVADR